MRLRPASLGVIAHSGDARQARARKSSRTSGEWTSHTCGATLAVQARGGWPMKMLDDILEFGTRHRATCGVHAETFPALVLRCHCCDEDDASVQFVGPGRPTQGDRQSAGKKFIADYHRAMRKVIQ
jgi:hypothetical protein